jgi:hypothetical protein
MVARPFTLPQLEAQRINHVLGGALNQVEITLWWNTPNSRLNGKTPSQVWRSESIQTSDIFEAVQVAALADASKLGNRKIQPSAIGRWSKWT